MIIQTVKNWIRVSRVNFIPVSILPYAVGAFFAARDCPFHLLKLLLGLFGASLVLIGACLLNEYWDYRFRADLLEDGRHPHFGGSKAIQEGVVSPAAVLYGPPGPASRLPFFWEGPYPSSSGAGRWPSSFGFRHYR